MTAKRLTISIPDALATNLDAVKEGLNVSQICAEALQKAVEEQQILTGYDAVERAVLRFRRQREEWSATSPKVAYFAGFEWVLRDASYDDIVDLFSRVEMDIETPVEWDLLKDEPDNFWTHLADFVDAGLFADGAPGDTDYVKQKVLYAFWKTLPIGWRKAGCEPGDVTRANGESEREREMRVAFLRGIEDAWNRVRPEVES